MPPTSRTPLLTLLPCSCHRLQTQEGLRNCPGVRRRASSLSSAFTPALPRLSGLPPLHRIPGPTTPGHAGLQHPLASPVPLSHLFPQSEAISMTPTCHIQGVRVMALYSLSTSLLWNKLKVFFFGYLGHHSLLALFFLLGKILILLCRLLFSSAHSVAVPQALFLTLSSYLACTSLQGCSCHT